MSLAAQELYFLSKRVVETHNGKHYPQAIKMEAMSALRAFIAGLGTSSDQPSARTAQVSER